MKWRVVIILLFMFSVLAGCTMGGSPWSRTGRPNCFGQTRHPGGESGLVFFCAESP